MIDAGNGKILSSAYESPKKEAAERAKDAPAEETELTPVRRLIGRPTSLLAVNPAPVPASSPRK
jgi:hypothetical protein